MGFWARLFGQEEKGWAQRELELLAQVYGTRETRSGVTVNWKTALEASVSLACARVCADGVSQVPLKLYKVNADESLREVARDHPVHRLLSEKPNDWQTSFEFRETMMFHLVFMGNFYAYKNIVRGEIKELIPFAHYDVQVEQLKDFTIRYRLKGPDGTFREVDPSLIWHVRGPSWNSWMGLEGIKLAREAIGLSKSIENSQADFQKGGARVSGLLSLEDTIGSERFEFLSKWIDRHAAGGDREGKTLVMDRGGKFATMQMSGVDQQLIESRKFQVEEVCRHFRVMPIMVGFSDKASTYASAEQMFLAHVVHCLSPWYTRLEQSIDAHLLTDQDRKDGYYSNFVEEGLLRGAMKDTADFLVRLTSGGLMTRNEGRAKLDMNPLAGLDEPLTPANTTIGADPAPPEPPTPPPA